MTDQELKDKIKDILSKQLDQDSEYIEQVIKICKDKKECTTLSGFVEYASPFFNKKSK